MSATIRWCPYCGAPIDAHRATCAAHSDLPERDPAVVVTKMGATAPRSSSSACDDERDDGRK